MNAPLRVLLIGDCGPAIEVLKADGFDPEWQRVESRPQISRALEERNWDIVLSGGANAAIAADDALAIVRQKDVDVPFLVVSNGVREDLGLAVREQLFRREQEFKALVENSPDLIARFDRQLRRRYVNPAIERLTGKRAHELIGTTLRDRNFDERYVAPLEQAIVTAFSSGVAKTLDVRLPSAADERRFQARIVPEFTMNGVVESVLVISRDITALHRSEERMRDLVDTAHEGIVTLDLDGTILAVNPAFVRMIGEPAAAIAGRRITDFIHADVLKNLTKIAERGEVAPIAASLRRRDGEVVQVEATASSQKREGSDAIFVIARDVTERKRAEAERQSLAREVRLLLASTYEGICAVDLDGCCTLVNESAASMLGYTREELMGRNLHELIHDRAADGSACFRRKDGTSFPVEVFVSPMFDEEGRLRGKVESFIDVTERRALQAELERANRMAGLGRAATIMSHQFDSVLTGIQPFAEMLLRSSTDARATAAASRILDAIDRGRRATADLRTFTRPEPPRKTRIELGSWLIDCVGDLRRILRPDIRIHVETASVPMPIEADGSQLAQAIGNIVLNARDASGDAAGAIHVRARIDGGAIHLTVADDGEGIDAANLTHVMEPFFTTRSGRAGLGLTTAAQIVTAHGGTVSVESERGTGTTVHVSLPVVAEPR